jgi:hypothetical protein
MITKAKIVRIASWNVNSLTGKSVEIVNTLHTKRVDVCCLQETRWKGQNTRLIKGQNSSYKLFWSGNKSDNFGGVGVMVAEWLAKDIIEVLRPAENIMAVKILLGKQILTIYSVYAPQQGKDEKEKENFWLRLEAEKLTGQCIIAGDFNGHVGENANGFEVTHGGRGFGIRNKEGEKLLEFAEAKGFLIANTHFDKPLNKRATYQNGDNITQIDYVLVKTEDRRYVKNISTVIEECANQHKLLMTDMMFTDIKKKKTSTNCSKFKLTTLADSNIRQKYQLDIGKNLCKNDTTERKNSQALWENFKEAIIASATENCGRQKQQGRKRAMWWNEEVAQAIDNKKRTFKIWKNAKTDANREHYNEAKKIAKQEVAKAIELSHKKFTENVNKPSNMKYIYNLAKQVKFEKVEVGNPKIIRNCDKNIVAEEEQVKQVWQQYYKDALNQRNKSELELPEVPPVSGPEKDITNVEVAIALNHMKMGKSGGESEVTTELLKAGGQIAVEYLTKLFNQIWSEHKLPEDWTKSLIVPIYKRKGDTLICANYRPIKLVEHPMKILEKVIMARLKNLIDIDEMQRGFVAGRSTMDAIFLVRQIQEKFLEKHRTLWMAFVDLEKAYDRVPRELVFWALRRKQVPETLIELIRTLYQNSKSIVKTAVGNTKAFQVDVGVHQGSALSPLLFIIVMEEITKDIKQGLPFEVLFADDLVLMDENEGNIRDKLLLWQTTLEKYAMKVNFEKTKVMECKKKAEIEESAYVKWPCAVCKKGVGSNAIQCMVCKLWVHHRCSGESKPLIKLQNFTCSICSGQKQSNIKGNNTFTLKQGVVLEKVTSFSYLGDKIQANGGAQEAVRNRIRVAWSKWREVASLLVKKEIAIKNRAIAYKIYIRSSLIYGSETWALTESDKAALNRTELKMLRWMMGNSSYDKSEKYIREVTNVESIVEIITQHRLKWFGHVSRMPDQSWIKKCLYMNIAGKRERGRPAKKWMDLVNKDMRDKGLVQQVTHDRVEWKERLRTKRPNPGN